MLILTDKKNVSYDPTLTIREFILDILGEPRCLLIDGNFTKDKSTFLYGNKILNREIFLDK